MIPSGRPSRKRGRNLTHLPPIGPGNPAGDLPVGEPMEGDAGVIGEALLASSDLLDRVLGDGEPSFPGKPVDEAPVEIGGEFHEQKVDLISPSVKIHPPILFISRSDTENMSERVWEKRPRFIEWVDEAKARLKESGKKGTLAEVAEIMGLAANSLKKYTSEEWNGAKPGDDPLMKLGDFLGRDYRMLYDDPRTAPPGLSASLWLASSNRTKVLASAMFEDLLQFPEGEQDIYYELWQKGVKIGLARREAEGKPGAKKR